MTEVIVVGGGPIGLRVAELTSKAGLDTVVLEEDMKIGRPIECAGLVSPRLLSLTRTKSEIKKSKKAIINPPNGEPLILKAPNDRAAIIDRGEFDRERARNAVESGAEIRLNSQVVDIEKDEKISVIYKQEGIRKRENCKIIVGADGPNSRIRSLSGFDRPDRILPGIQAIIGEESEDIEIFLGNKIAPGFFAWELPFPNGKLIGLACNNGDVFKLVNRLLKRKNYSNKVIGFLSGTIPLGKMDESVKDSIMLVGDAACQVKPLSGGGLYTGLKSAEHCADVIIRALEKDDTSQRVLQEYHNRWQKDVGKEISKGLWLRKAYRSLSDEEIDELIDMLRNEKVKNIIEQEGDIDYPSSLAKPVLKASPKLIKFAGPFIKNLF